MENDVRVSVVVPVRNEEKYIEECLDSLINQDFPDAEYEIIVVDGESEDQTRDIVEEHLEGFKNIRLVENPQRNVAEGKRIGFEEAEGDFVIDFGGHSFADEDFISKLVSRLEKSDDDVAGVGCVHEIPPDESSIPRAIGKALATPFGGLGTTFRQMENERVVDSVAFTAYKKDIVDEVGGPSNPKLEHKGNDAELGLRLKEAGYKLIQIPNTSAYHHKRDSLGDFWKWIVNYGVGRANIVKMHGLNNPYYLLPSILVIGGLFVAFMSLFSSIFRLFFVFSVSAYFLASFVSSATICDSVKEIPLLMVVYLIEHFGYGVGFLSGLITGGYIENKG